MFHDPKEILFENAARLKLKEGIDLIANLVKCTLGPSGRNIGLEEAFNTPKIVNKGNRITRDLEVKDPSINMGICLAKQAASRIKEKAGDGTTTAIILLQAIVAEGFKYLIAGKSSTEIQEEMEKASKKVLKEIEQRAYPIKNLKDIKNIATISASSNPIIGEMIAEAYEQTGVHGSISIEEAEGYQTYISLTEGMEIESGYMNSYFITDKDKMQVTLLKPRVLIYDQKISSIQQILSLVNSFVGTEKQLFIIADDVSPDVLSTLALNHIKKIIKVCVVKAPGSTLEKQHLLEDLAIFTDCEVISEQKGMKLRDITIDRLGACEKIVISKERCSVIGSRQDQIRMDKRVQQLETLSKQGSKSEQTFFKKLKGRLLGKFAVIHVGAYSEQELFQKKQLFQDSLECVKCALSDGITIGGGMSFYLASLKLEKEKSIGAKILAKALKAPLFQIIQNTGFHPTIILEEIALLGEDFGFNAQTENVDNLYEAGVIDPIKVLKSSFIHSFSIAKTVLLTEALIYKVEK